MAEELDGTVWVLSTLGDAPALPGTEVTLSLEGGAMSGTDGCNRYRGNYTAEGGSFTAGAMATTMMACPEPVMAQAAAYSAALREATGFAVDGGHLALTDATGAVRATFTAQDRELAGTSWVVTGYNNGKQAVVSLLLGTEITATWGEAAITGSAGCNRYTAPVVVDGVSVTIGPAAATRRLCAEPDGVMEQEGRYLRALESAATLRLEGRRLELRTADGALAVSLTRLP